MPLSEHEQRLLEQMERALYADDPKFASSLRAGHGAGHHRRRLTLGAIGLLAGIGLLLAGVMQPLPIVGVVGFVLMLVSAWWAMLGWRTRAAAPSASAAPGTAAKAGKKPKRGFMTRMEDRWQRRQEGDQRP